MALAAPDATAFLAAGPKPLATRLQRPGRVLRAAETGSAAQHSGVTTSFVGAAVAVAGLQLLRAKRARCLAARVQRHATVFIDGEAGTTGLQVRERLEAHPGIKILSLEPEKRKDEAARKEALQTADAAVLCLPDDAAKAAVKLAEGSKTVIVDASTAHRVAEGWTYGFAEMSADQAKAIASSKRIANPGCYPTGFIGLVRPLVDAGILPKDALLTVPAVSGYSGGGKGLIDIYEGPNHEPWGAYSFNLAHKHLAEMCKCTGLKEEPLFLPAVGGFKQGMVVSVPLRVSQLAPGTTGATIHDALAAHYAGKKFVKVYPLNAMDVLERGAFLRPDTVNNTNKLELFVYANEAKGTMWLAARLDNLGKGASGACVQNLNLALGFDEATGLEA